MNDIEKFYLQLKKWKSNKLKDYELHDCLVVMAQDIIQRKQVVKGDYNREEIFEWASKELDTVSNPLDVEL